MECKATETYLRLRGVPEMLGENIMQRNNGYIGRILGRTTKKNYL